MIKISNLFHSDYSVRKGLIFIQCKFVSLLENDHFEAVADSLTIQTLQWMGLSVMFVDDLMAHPINDLSHQSNLEKINMDVLKIWNITNICGPIWWRTVVTNFRATGHWLLSQTSQLPLSPTELTLKHIGLRTGLWLDMRWMWFIQNIVCITII